MLNPELSADLTYAIPTYLDDFVSNQNFTDPNQPMFSDQEFETDRKALEGLILSWDGTMNGTKDGVVTYGEFKPMMDAFIQGFQAELTGQDQRDPAMGEYLSYARKCSDYVFARMPKLSENNPAYVANADQAWKRFATRAITKMQELYALNLPDSIWIAKRDG